jgi:GWxTD domain-containing protein
MRSLERAGADYAKALEVDRRFIPAAVAWADIELGLMDTARLRWARDELRRVAEAAVPNPPELSLALGRLERATGDLNAAGATFERYLLTGGNRAVGLIELARARLAMGRSDGEAPYYEGATLDDPIATAEYRADLQLIATNADLDEFDWLKGSARSAFLHRFWTDRDHLELRHDGERLREHYRRLLFARSNFPLTVSRRFYGRVDAYRSDNIEVDDRGVIYIRHGEPTLRLRPFVFATMPNESWRYAHAEGDLLFHFSAGYDSHGGGDLYDYRLVQSVLDLRGASEAPRDQLILSRQSLSPLYNKMLNWGDFGAAAARVQERTLGARSIAVGTTTDSYELQFNRKLRAVGDLVAVGRSSKGSLGHFVFGIAEPGTTGQPSASGLQYSVRVRLAALDDRNRAVARLDTVVTIVRAHPLGEHEYLIGRATLSLPPGRWSYRAVLQQGDSAGVVLPRDSVRVSPTDGVELALSDIALGTPGNAVPWFTETSNRVLLAPTALFRKGDEIDVYYEASGAKAGQQYRHEITVLRRKKGESGTEGKALVSLSFEEEAPADVIRSSRIVRLDRLKPGDYMVEVKIIGADGDTRVRRRAIRLTKPD